MEQTVITTGTKRKAKWKIFIVTGIADLVAAFAINSMNLALPYISQQLHVSQSTVSWLTLVYSLIPCCTLLAFGRIGDLFGYKRQFIVGFISFGLVSLALPLVASGIGSLIFFRCLQGLGYSMLMSITQATVKRNFDPSECGKAIGFNSMFVSIGLAAGPTIGGVLLKYFTWHAIFYFNVPFCVIGLIATIFILENDKGKTNPDRRIDFPGMILFAVGISALVVAINFSNRWGWASIKFIICLLISVLFLVVFVFVEQHTDFPLISMEYFKNRSFSLANAACVCSYFTQQMTTYLVPFFLINILELPSDVSGLVMLASPLPMMVFSPIGGKYSDRHGPRSAATLGLMFIVCAGLIMAMLRESFGVLPVIAALFLIGAGNGYSVSAINASILTSVPSSSSGAASGMVATMRNLGQALGVAFGSAIIATRETAYLTSGLGEKISYVHAQRDAFLLSVAVTCIAIVLIRMLPKKQILQ